MVKVQLFFDSLKKIKIDTEKEVKYVIKKQNDILRFNWPDDTLFDKWMVDIASNEQWEKLENDSNEMDHD